MEYYWFISTMLLLYFGYYSVDLMFNFSGVLTMILLLVSFMKIYFVLLVFSVFHASWTSLPCLYSVLLKYEVKQIMYAFHYKLKHEACLFLYPCCHIHHFADVCLRKLNKEKNDFHPFWNYWSMCIYWL